jgi:Sel1 repeat
MRNGLAPWASWMPTEKKPTGVEMTLPGTLDPNHLDGIGPLWLLAHLRVTSIGGPGITDFDQAEITIRLRSHDLDLKGARILWWLTRQLPKEDTDPEFPWQETNWALTCCDLGSKLSEDWTTVTVKIDDDPSRWTYAGTNVMQFGDWGRRYVEYPLNKLLNNSTGSLHLAIVGISAAQPPSGKIEISEITIRTKQAARPLPFDDIVRLLEQGRWDEVRWNLKRLLPSDDPTPNYYYGRALALGLGGNQDYQQAAIYLQKASDLPEARIELAKLYLYGLGVPRDQAKAVRLLETGSTATDPEASYLLGLAYDSGIGAEKDDQKAMSLFRSAAESGQSHAMHELARRLAKSDPAEALYWYKLARKQLGPEVVGAETQMLDWNIQRLSALLPPSVLEEQRERIDHWTVKPPGSVEIPQSPALARLQGCTPQTNRVGVYEPAGKCTTAQ